MKNMILVLFLCSTLACEKSQDTTLEAPKAPVLKDMVESQQKNTDGSVVYTTRQVPDQALESWKAEYQKTDLQRLPISSVYNVPLYTIQNVKDFKGVAFVAPKLFAYRSSDGARIALSDNEDGTVSIPFPVIMVDGFKAQVEDPSTLKMITLPGSFLVQDLAGLKKELAERFQITQVAPLDGCPKQFVIKVADREYDVTPKDLAHSDHCELNKPFTLSLRVTKNEARYILQKALYHSLVDIRGVYQTRVSYTVAEMSLDFDKQKVFSEIQAHLNGKYKFLAEVDLRVLIRKILSEQSLSFHLKGEYSAQMENLVSDILTEFFVPMKEDPEMPVHDCATGVALCFSMSSAEQTEKRAFKMSWVQSTSTLTGQTILTTTKLQPLNDKQIEIGELQPDLSNPVAVKRPSLSNKGNPIETDLTVNDGDYLEITPAFLDVETFALPTPTTERPSNLVCLESRTEKYDCEPRKIRPSGTVNGWCQTRVICERSEDQWVETTTYSNIEAKMERHLKPVGRFEQLFEGLHLKFTVARNVNGNSVTKEFTCPLNIFQREGDGSSLAVRLESRPGCEIFSKENLNRPMLHIVSNIQFPTAYRKGRDIKNWKNEILETSTVETFYPTTEFGGILSIRGYQIDSLAQ